MPTPARRKKRSEFRRKRNLKGKLDRMHRKIHEANRQSQQPGYVK